MKERKKVAGRTKGTPNKITATIRESLRLFLEKQQPEVEKAFKKLRPKEKVLAYTKLLPYVTPAYQSISFDLSSMSDENLDVIINHLKKKGIPEQPETENDLEE